jgi:ubiquinone/menaquinone biosynthesis C-methylase UbiE
MSSARNPQAAQMADESMVRTLHAQAEVIWPQEQQLFARYGLRGQCHIADIGCGSGEITSRLALMYQQANLIGVDILDGSIAYARSRYAGLAPRLGFEQGDAFALALPSAEFDLVVCRHMTQSIPEPEKALAELHRICRPGGWLHVLSEDYGMLHMAAGRVDPDRLWREGALCFGSDTGVDLRIGRRTWSLLHQLGLEELHVDYVVVDTVRVPRETFANILTAWRDGYAETISKHSKLRLDEVRALFDQIIASIRNPNEYAVWHVPIVSGRKRSS